MADHDSDPIPSPAEVTRTVAMPAHGRPVVSKAVSDLPRGATLGRYVVLEQVGAGGMGVVYGAYDPELDRKVALKVLRGRGPDTAHQRLLREAQALARLDHPNVLTVHDVGLVEGQVFLATAYLEGVTLDRWLQERERAVGEILEAFTQAGDGLVAAHDAGLIHRDFKPSNVMVTAEGRVLVLDFGLARSHDLDDLENEDGGVAVGRDLTQAGALIGTPSFMAPEQMAGRTVDARADQFSFAIALFRALFGVPPFSLRPDAVHAGDLVDWTPVEMPRRPHVPTPVRLALRRALAIDPEQRFPTMRPLLSALRHDTTRRRRWAVVASVVTLAVAAAGWAGYQRAAQVRPALCQGGPSKLDGVWNATRRDAMTASFLDTARPWARAVWRTAESRLDTYGQAWLEAHHQACIATQRGEQSQELLDRRMACLDQRLQELRTVTDLFSNPVTEVLESAVDIATGLSPIAACEDAEALLRTAPPPEEVAAEVAAIQQRLAEERVHFLAGTYERGTTRVVPLVAAARDSGYRPVIAEAELLLGRLHHARRQPEEAETHLLAAIDAGTWGRHDHVVAQAQIERIRVAANLRSQFDDGRRFADDAEALLRGLGDPPALRLALLRGRSELLEELGEVDAARDAAEEALALAERAHSDALDIALIENLLGDLAAREGALEAARQHHGRALSITIEELGPLHPNVAILHDRLGSSAMQAGDLDAAIDHHRRALEIRELAGDENPQGLALSLLHLGSAEIGRGRHEEAVAYHERARRAFEEALGPDHPYVAVTLINQAVSRVEQQRYDEALKLYREALAIREAVYGRDHPVVAQVAFNLGVAHNKRGAHAEALTPLGRALAIWTQHRSDGDRRDALTALGEAHLGLGQAGRALTLLEEALILTEGDERSPEFAGLTQFALARALDALGRDPERAVTMARAARDNFERVPGISRRELAAVLAWLDERGASQKGSG